MAKIDTFECDICHTQKKETNHWWLVLRDDKILIKRFDFDEAKKMCYFHVCGVECALKLVGTKIQEMMNALI